MTEHSGLENQVTLVRALPTQDQQFMHSWVRYKTMDLGHIKRHRGHLKHISLLESVCLQQGYA